MHLRCMDVRHGRVKATLLAVLAGLLPSSIQAQPASAEGDGEERARHAAGLFLGVTLFEGEVVPTVGGDYEFRFLERVGVGAMVEYAAGGLDAGILAVPLVVHPVGELSLAVAPGLEVRAGEVDPLVRLGASYDFMLGDFFLAPVARVDLVARELVPVLGVELGHRF
ncbi:MAG: hypothetical protein L0Y66_18120 [Myxococcaceae bacterium]|nr:hypothetical protein [Myxococcaceae bacterium]MCI0673055.1 hypothetical protein [Myxococcaceae bacterium]